MERAGLGILYIEPGAPWENGFAESFFRRLRDELLNVEEFENLAEARWLWRDFHKAFNDGINQLRSKVSCRIFRRVEIRKRRSKDC
jgi:transposase InsO family protein